MAKSVRFYGILSFLLVAGLIGFAAGTQVVKAAMPLPTNANLTSEEPNWSDPYNVSKVQWLASNVFQGDSTANSYQRFNNLGPDDQIMLTQAHRLTQSNLRSSTATTQRPVGSGQNADCALISVDYAYTGPTGLKVLDFPAYHEICYHNGQILTNYSTASVNGAAPATSLWNYYSASSQITNGGNAQATIEITVQALYRLCTAAPNQGCVNRAAPAYKLTFDAANGTYRIEGIALPNPNR